MTADTLGVRMAGPAIRAWRIADGLADEHDVQLVTTARCEVSSLRFRCAAVDEDRLRELEQWCEVIVFQGYVLATFPWLRWSERVMVVDIYDPFHLEQLEQSKDVNAATRLHQVRESVSVSNEQLRRGDFFTCASDKQRDFWLGQLAGLGRLNPYTYDADESLDALIRIVPFGIESAPPVRTAPAARGVIDGIGADDRLVLWGGGIYNWFDPLTLVRAMALVAQQRSDVKLLFLGMQHPNPDIPEMRMSVATRRLADELGLTGRTVFFNEQWVPYEQRHNFLLDADIGVTTHFDHVETAFSFRTRVLDYLWASLPIVSTEGDTFAELVEQEGLGVVVPVQDERALADALLHLLAPDVAAQCRERIATVAPRFRWELALAPILEFCRDPRRAPDLVAEGFFLPGDAPPPPVPHGFRHRLGRLVLHLRSGTWPGAAVRLARRRLGLPAPAPGASRTGSSA